MSGLAVVLAGTLLLLLWARAPRQVWRAEGRAGFALDVPGTLPAGLSLKSASILSSHGAVPKPLAFIQYQGTNGAELLLFESPYPIAQGGLQARSGPAIIERTVGGKRLLEGLRKMKSLYVEAEGIGLDEPSFAAALESLRPADGGLAHVLFDRRAP